MTRQHVLGMIRACKEQGARVIVGGPEPANYVEQYLARGADVVVIGEGELTLEELLPHLASVGPSGLQAIRGIAFRTDDGRLVVTDPRPSIPDLDRLPFPDLAAVDVPE